MQRVKYQSLLIPILAGTTGTIDFPIKLDSKYQKCTGIAVVEPVANTENYSIGVSDSHESYHDIAHKKIWICGENVPVNERFKDVNITTYAEQQTMVRLKVNTTITANTNVEVYFKLVQDAPNTAN
jgi:hypothetical protein